MSVKENDESEAANRVLTLEDGCIQLGTSTGERLVELARRAQTDHSVRVQHGYSRREPPISS